MPDTLMAVACLSGQSCLLSWDASVSKWIETAECKVLLDYLQLR